MNVAPQHVELKLTVLAEMEKLKCSWNGEPQSFLRHAGLPRSLRQEWRAGIDFLCCRRNGHLGHGRLLP